MGNVGGADVPVLTGLELRVPRRLITAKIIEGKLQGFVNTIRIPVPESPETQLLSGVSRVQRPGQIFRPAATFLEGPALQAVFPVATAAADGQTGFDFGDKLADLGSELFEAVLGGSHPGMLYAQALRLSDQVRNFGTPGIHCITGPGMPDELMAGRAARPRDVRISVSGLLWYSPRRF